jgi:hypothetical protein
MTGKEITVKISEVSLLQRLHLVMEVRDGVESVMELEEAEDCLIEWWKTWHWVRLPISKPMWELPEKI